VADTLPVPLVQTVDLEDRHPKRDRVGSIKRNWRSRCRWQLVISRAETKRERGYVGTDEHSVKDEESTPRCTADDARPFETCV